MQTRRDFFKSISGVFLGAAAVSIPSVPWGLSLLEGPPMKSGTAIAAIHQREGVVLQFHELTRWLHDCILEDITWPTEVVGDSKIGMGAMKGLFGIDLDLKDAILRDLSDEEIINQYVLPMKELMVNELKYYRPARFGKLYLPSSVDMACVSADERFALRGVRAYDIRDDSYKTRFETLFG